MMDRIIAQSEDEFRRGAVSLRKVDLAAIVNLIQREMQQEQDEFNRLTERLQTMDSNSRDYSYLEKARIQSQTRLTSLMNKSMICLNQQQSVSDGTVEPETPRRPAQKGPAPKAPVAPKTAVAAKTVTLEPSSLHGTATLSSSVRIAANQSDEAARSPGGQNFVWSKANSNSGDFANRHSNAVDVRNDDRKGNNGADVTANKRSWSKPNNSSDVTANRTVSGKVNSSGVVSVNVNSLSSANSNNSSCDGPRKDSVDGSSIAANGSSEEVEARAPNARSLIANFERLSTSGDSATSVTRPPRRSSSSSFVDGVAAERPSTFVVPQSASMAQISPSNGTAPPPKRTSLTPRHVEIVEKAPSPHPSFRASTEVIPRTASASQKSSSLPAKSSVVLASKEVIPRTTSASQKSPGPPAKSSAVRASEEGILKSYSVPQKSPGPPAKSPPVRVPEAMISRTASATQKSPGPPAKPPPVRASEEGILRTASAAVVNTAPTSPSVLRASVIGEEKVQPAPSLKFWDPAKLIADIFAVRLATESVQTPSAGACSGILDKLPDQKKKNTMLKTWKRRFFVADQGELRTFDTGVTDPNTAVPVQVFTLSGGRVDDLGDQMIGIDDGCGRFVTVRCSSASEHARWLKALTLQAGSEHRPHHVIPVLKSGPHPSRKVLIVDIGSRSIRAGVLGSAAALPTLYFPAVAALEVGDKGTVVAVGGGAFAPEIRTSCQLIAPARADTTIENVAFERGILRAIFQHIFKSLSIEPKTFTVLLSVPNSTSEQVRGKLSELLFDTFSCPAVAMCGQAVLALYAYGMSTGVVVDLGHRMEILPVTDGLVQKGGVARQPYGGARIAAALNLHLAERGCRFHSDAEMLLTQHIVQQAAYVCDDPDTECDVTNVHEEIIDLSPFDLPPEYLQSVSVLANGRCRCTEGLFNPADYFGMDTPSLPRLVQRAISACPMDLRRDLARRIVLSGGTTLLPGFARRLETEVTKLLPALSVPRIHAAPNRLHAAFLGANRLAGMEEFDALCVKRQLWAKSGARAIVGKWTV